MENVIRRNSTTINYYILLTYPSALLRVIFRTKKMINIW